MLELIQQIDTQLFYFFNNTIANPLFDKFMPFITEGKHWLLLYFSSIALLLWKGGKRERIFVIILLVSVISANHINSDILKDVFDRLRPCKTLEDVRLLVNCGSGKSFPSSHAVNNFALAYVVAHYYRQYSVHIYIMASIVAFSRIYNGVHYPVDILAGALVGFLIGMFFSYIADKTLSKHLAIESHHPQSG